MVGISLRGQRGGECQNLSELYGSGSIIDVEPVSVDEGKIDIHQSILQTPTATSNNFQITSMMPTAAIPNTSSSHPVVINFSFQFTFYHFTR